MKQRINRYFNNSLDSWHKVIQVTERTPYLNREAMNILNYTFSMHHVNANTQVNVLYLKEGGGGGLSNLDHMMLQNRMLCAPASQNKTLLKIIEI